MASVPSEFYCLILFLEITGEKEMEKITELHVDGMTCKSCVQKIQDHMTKEPGVISIQVRNRVADEWGGGGGHRCLKIKQKS